MARISCEMTDVVPTLHRRYDSARADQEIWTLLVRTDAGLLDLEISPEQARSIAYSLYLRFGWDGEDR